MTLPAQVGNVPPEWFDGIAAGPDLDLFGPTVASVAGLITLPYRYQVVSGALAITGINLPSPNFSGMISVFPTGAFTWTAAININTAGTAVVGRKLDFFYFPPTAKWYASYL